MAKPPETSLAFIEGLDVSAYGIARSLGRHGVRSIALNDKLQDNLRFSRYCRGCRLFPDDPTQQRTYAGDVIPNEDLLCGLMLEWGSRFTSKPVLYATSDWFTRFLCNRQQELSSSFVFHWVPKDVYTTITEKGLMAEFCAKAGVHVPKTYVTKPEDDITQIAKQVSFPCLVKPVHRHSVRFPIDSKLFVANTSHELESFFAAYPQLKGGTLVQEMIEGGDDQIFQYTANVSKSGEIQAYATVRKLHQYPHGYGSMCHGQAEQNEELAKEAVKVLCALGYRGLGSLEFKRRASDGHYYFIEMNTRLPWYNGIFADAGVNLAYLAYLDLTGDVADCVLQSNRQRNVRWVSFRNYAKWYRESDRQSYKTRRQWVSSVIKARSFAWWNWRDPMPFLASGLSAGRRLGGRMLRAAHLR